MPKLADGSGETTWQATPTGKATLRQQNQANLATKPNQQSHAKQQSQPTPVLPNGLLVGSPEEALDCACGLYLDKPA